MALEPFRVSRFELEIMELGDEVVLTQRSETAEDQTIGIPLDQVGAVVRWFQALMEEKGLK